MVKQRITPPWDQRGAGSLHLPGFPPPTTASYTYILIYLYEPETRILSAVGTKNERCHLFCHSCGVLLSSNVPDFKRQFVTGVYWRYLVKFDFANKEDQPRAGTRLRRVLVKVKKIENR